MTNSTATKNLQVPTNNLNIVALTSNEKELDRDQKFSHLKTLQNSASTSINNGELLNGNGPPAPAVDGKASAARAELSTTQQALGGNTTSPRAGKALAGNVGEGAASLADAALLSQQAMQLGDAQMDDAAAQPDILVVTGIDLASLPFTVDEIREAVYELEKQLQEQPDATAA